jgi:hypothetical protein
MKNIDEVFSKKENSVREFFFQIYTNEVPGLENLFLKSLDNLVKIIKKEIEKNKYKNFFLISTGNTYEIDGEENNIFLKEMKDLYNVNSRGLTIKDFINLYKNSEVDLNESFIYDDFTEKELLEYCNANGLDFEEVKNIFSEINSFYPKDIDFATDRDFAEILNAYNTNYPLVREIINSQNIDRENLPNIDGKVLKFKDTNSGKGIYLPGEFDKEFIIDSLEKELEFTLEDFINGSKIYVWENEKLIEKVVDVRFGFYYDPEKPDEIQTITTYGRYNDKGKKSNIAQGGGVCEVSIVADDKYTETQKTLLSAYRELSKDGTDDLDMLSKILKINTEKAGLKYNEKAFPISPIPFVICESAFKEIEKTALFLAKKMVEKREGENKGFAFIFALDAFINPAPAFYQAN